MRRNKEHKVYKDQNGKHSDNKNCHDMKCDDAVVICGCKTHIIDKNNYDVMDGVDINCSGQWKVRQNLKYKGKDYAIRINVDNVVLDFCGNTLDLCHKGNNAIDATGRKNVEIKNGKIMNTSKCLPIPVCDWNVGPALSFPNGLPTDWDHEMGSQSILEFFRVGDFYGCAQNVPFDPKTSIAGPGVDARNADPTKNNYFPNVTFVGPVRCTAISISNTELIHIHHMTFERCYICIEGVNGPVRQLIVEDCHGFEFGARIKSETDKLAYPYSNSITQGYTYPIEYFGSFLNLARRDGAGSLVMDNLSKDIFVRNNILNSSLAGNVVYVIAAESVHVDYNKMRLPYNEDGWERNENWAVTYTNVRNFTMNNNELIEGIHLFSPWGATSGTCSDNLHLDSHEQTCLPKACINVEFARNRTYYQSSQFKAPAKSSLTFIGNSPITGMSHVGVLDVNPDIRESPENIILGTTGPDATKNKAYYPEIKYTVQKTTEDKNLYPNLPPGSVIYYNPSIYWYSRKSVNGHVKNGIPDPTNKTSDPMEPWELLQGPHQTATWSPTSNCALIPKPATSTSVYGVIEIDPPTIENVNHCNCPDFPQNDCVLSPGFIWDPKDFPDHSNDNPSNYARVYGCYDHNDGWMFFQCIGCLIEDNIVSGFKEPYASSVGFEFLSTNASWGNVVRRNTAFNNIAGYRVLYGGTAGSVIGTGKGPVINGMSSSIPGKGNQNPGIPKGYDAVFYPNSYYFEDNKAYGNGQNIDGIWYNADFVGLYNFKGVQSTI